MHQNSCGPRVVNQPFSGTEAHRDSVSLLCVDLWDHRCTGVSVALQTGPTANRKMIGNRVINLLIVATLALAGQTVLALGRCGRVWMG